MRRVLFATALAALAGLALLPGQAPAWKGFTLFRVNLDRDSAMESIRTIRVPRRGIDRTGVNVRDACPAGTIDLPVAGPEEDLVFLATTRADTRSGREILIDLRARNDSRGQVRLVGWRRSAATVCRRPRQLFVYKRPPQLPRGARKLATFDLSVNSLTRAFRGKEIKLVERFWRPGERFVPCASLVRRSLYRYSARKDRYVRYSRQHLRRSVPSGCN